MTIYSPHSSGLGAVGSYQVSGKPFFKGGLIATTTNVRVIEFPSVTNWIYVLNTHDTGLTTDGPMIAFSENGFDTNNYFVLHSTHFQHANTTPLYFKVSRLYYKSTSGNRAFDIVAGLTGIPTTFLPNNWSGSAGVG